MMFLLLLVGCPKQGSASLDPVLPEDVTPILAQEPLAELERGADSLEPGPRARALALLVENGADPAHWGARALLDPSDWVRRSAVDALARRPDDVTRQMLEEVAENQENDPYLRAFAALRAKGDAARTAMTEALTHEHEAWRVAPLALAAVQLGDEAARQPLLAALGTGELALDLSFLEEVGDSGDASLLPALARAQDRVEEELALPVASARLRLGDASAEQPLRRALGDADEERRLEALDYLVDLDEPAANALLRRASEDGPELVAWYANLALAARTGTDGDVFERAYADPDRELREMAVRFAGRAVTRQPNKRVSKAATKVVLSGLADADAGVRIEACRAVSENRMMDGRAPALLLLSDEVQTVRIEASGALLALAEP